MLEVNKLTAVRDERPLFRNIEFSVRGHEILHIQGRNGAGKTTLLRMLCGLRRPDSGEIWWKGTKIDEIAEDYNRSFVYVGHENGIKADLTAYENLAFDRALGNSASLTPIPEILKRFGIARYVNVPSRYLSAGQKRRVALARLLLSDARLWLLDEPLTALDEPAQNILYDLMDAHLEAGGLCIATSHQRFRRDWPNSRVIDLDSLS